MLAAVSQQYASALEAITERLIELLPTIRGSYYHPDFRGSVSIQAVLPIIAPTQDHNDLEIAADTSASPSHMRALTPAGAGE